MSIKTNFRKAQVWQKRLLATLAKTSQEKFLGSYCKPKQPNPTASFQVCILCLPPFFDALDYRPGGITPGIKCIWRKTGQRFRFRCFFRFRFFPQYFPRLKILRYSLKKKPPRYPVMSFPKFTHVFPRQAWRICTSKAPTLQAHWPPRRLLSKVVRNFLGGGHLDPRTYLPVTLENAFKICWI